LLGNLGSRLTSTSEDSKLTKFNRHVSSKDSDPRVISTDTREELWFESDQAMNAALNSPEMGAAVDDAKRFLDMERTGMIIVDEKTVIG
ncbi:MAG: EthD domain-containing protein, partial [Acidobacteria bacterium]|nr:EthD domain-containing protein [Acidobacteriota bacterium]